MKKTSKKNSTFNSNEEALKLAGLAATLGFKVEVQSTKEDNQFLIKHPQTSVVVEKYSFNLNQMEHYRVATFLQEVKETKEREAKVESCYLALIDSLSPEFKQALSVPG